jgi:hypothetical protein
MAIQHLKLSFCPKQLFNYESLSNVDRSRDPEQPPNSFYTASCHQMTSQPSLKTTFLPVLQFKTSSRSSLPKTDFRRQPLSAKGASVVNSHSKKTQTQLSTVSNFERDDDK